MPSVDSMLAVLILAALHVYCVRLKVIRQEEHSPWLSFAGGVAVAYVFVVLLPKLSDWQVTVAQMQRDSLLATPLGPQEMESVKKFLIYEVFLSALAGLVVFYGLGRAVYWLRQRQRKENRATVLAIGLLWLNLAVFAGIMP